MNGPINDKNTPFIPSDEFQKMQQMVEEVETKVTDLEKQMEVLARHMVRVGEQLDLLLKTGSK
ncbi:hypothetical protein [Heliorestis convoluta]|uniref:Uncharacterized protein n=1 Tax=Heliorestis convoluta TaxID=356322 RepID=A0A5Q2N2T2_9FIRM|nr:hypothetical protein [Heliorestis convoluta]QGG49308.1 hypothetical protein FTV88_3242 [Heliorestis convoluta]